jgi:hypothetical protein
VEKLIVFASVGYLTGEVRRDYTIEAHDPDRKRKLYDSGLLLAYTDTDDVRVVKDYICGKVGYLMSQEWAELLIQTHVQKCTSPPSRGRTDP